MLLENKVNTETCFLLLIMFWSEISFAVTQFCYNIPSEFRLPQEQEITIIS